MPNDLNACRVCGYRDNGVPPWGADGTIASFTICECCGVEHGYEDCLPDGVREYRKEWIRAGCHWFAKSRKPDKWSLDEQLLNVPDTYK